MINLENKDDREKLEKITSGIYSITNIANNKIYIGSAVNLTRRWKHHIKDLKNKTHRNILLQRTYDKYGIEIFEFKVIERVQDKSKLLEREGYWMDKLECHDRDKGYNLLKTPTSQFGIKRSEEAKLNMKGINKGFKHTSETKAKMAAAKLGTKQSDEHKRKRSEALKGRVHSKEALAKQSLAKRGKKKSQEFREMRRKIQTGKRHSAETRAKMSETRKRKYAEKCIILTAPMIVLN